MSKGSSLFIQRTQKSCQQCCRKGAHEGDRREGEERRRGGIRRRRGGGRGGATLWSPQVVRPQDPRNLKLGQRVREMDGRRGGERGECLWDDRTDNDLRYTKDEQFRGKRDRRNKQTECCTTAEEAGN